MNSEKQERLKKANQLIETIATHGRRFFFHKDRISRLEVDSRGRIWFVDAYKERWVYTHYTQGRWLGFSEGGTLRDLIIRLRDYIRIGKKVVGALGPWPEWWSEQDPWGYKEDMQVVYQKAVELGIVEAK